MKFIQYYLDCLSHASYLLDGHVMLDEERHDRRGASAALQRERESAIVERDRRDVGLRPNERRNVAR